MEKIKQKYFGQIFFKFFSFNFLATYYPQIFFLHLFLLRRKAKERESPLFWVGESGDAPVDLLVGGLLHHSNTLRHHHRHGWPIQPNDWGVWPRESVPPSFPCHLPLSRFRCVTGLSGRESSQARARLTCAEKTGKGKGYVRALYFEWRGDRITHTFWTKSTIFLYPWMSPVIQPIVARVSVSVSVPRCFEKDEEHVIKLRRRLAAWCHHHHHHQWSIDGQWSNGRRQEEEDSRLPYLLQGGLLPVDWHTHTMSSSS